MFGRRREIKDEAASLLRKGKYQKALELFEQVAAKDPNDYSTRRNVGYILRKLGRVQEAVEVFVKLANEYADDGFMLKAIATCKVVLEMDPDHKEVQQRLADLYSNRTSTPSPAVKVMAEEPQDDQPPVSVGSMGLATDSIDLPTGDEPSFSVDRSTPIDQLQKSGGLPVIEMLEIQPLPMAAPAPVEKAPPPEPAPVADATAPIELESASDSPGLELATGADDGLMELEPTSVTAPAVSSTLDIEIQPLQADELELTPQKPPAEEAPAEEAPAEQAPAEEPAPIVLTQVKSSPAGAEAEPVAPEGAPAADDIPLDIEISLDFEDEDAPPKKEVNIDIPLFCDLEPEAFVAILEKMKMTRMQKGQWILKEGAPGSSMFTIASGKVRILKRLGDRKALQLAVLGEGTFFGEMSLLRGGVRGASVQAVEAGDLFEISRELVDQVSEKYPAVTEVLHKFAQQRMLRNVMSTSHLFKPFNKKEKVDIIERFVSRDFEAGQVMIEEDKESDGLYLLMRGQLDVTSKADGDQEHLVGELNEGEIFGEISCLRKEPAIATVRARTPGTVLRLPRSDFDMLVMSHPQILELISALSEERITLTSNALAEKGILI